MRHLVLSVFLIGCFVTLAPAQSKDDFDRFEIFAGYSHLFVENSENEVRRDNVEGGLTDINWMNGEATRTVGVNLAAAGNLRRYLGLKVDFSTYRNRLKYEENPALPEGAISPPHTIKDLGASLYNFMGGVQLKDNRKQKIIKPFAHLLFGRVLSREEKQLDFNCPRSGELLYSERMTVTSTGFAGAAGGGLDVRFNDHMDLRLVQIDLYRSNVGSSRRSGFRMGIGVVFR